MRSRVVDDTSFWSWGRYFFVVHFTQRRRRFSLYTKCAACSGKDLSLSLSIFISGNWLLYIWDWQLYIYIYVGLATIYVGFATIYVGFATIYVGIGNYKCGIGNYICGIGRRCPLATIHMWDPPRRVLERAEGKDGSLRLGCTPARWHGLLAPSTWKRTASVWHPLTPRHVFLYDTLTRSPVPPTVQRRITGRPNVT